MKIEVRSALGFGATALAAFDDALLKAGVANYNLIRLSSVIPSGAKIVSSKKPNTLKALSDEFGWRLYAVYAVEQAAPGQSAWAGVGWIQRPDGRGLFVEHEGSQKAAVIRSIDLSLNQMKRSRRWPAGPNRKIVVGGSHRQLFSCALAVAAYQSQAWPESESRR